MSCVLVVSFGYSRCIGLALWVVFYANPVVDKSLVNF